MNVTETASEGLSRTLRITVPQADLAARLDARIAEIQPEVRLKGFRPGKVPASHIKKMFGRSMMEEIVQTVIDEGRTKALEEKGLRAASPPEVKLDGDAETIANGEADLAFEVQLEIMPEFTPADPADVSLERPTAPVSEEQVLEAMERLADQNRLFESKEDRVSEDGDQVFCDFLGKVNGESFDGGAAEGAEITIGEGRLIPGFEEQLIGAKAGDKVDVNVTFPDDYPRQELQGQDAHFAVDVREVRVARRMEVGDELARHMGLEDIAKLREAVRANLEREHTFQSRARAKRRLLDILDEQHDFQLPTQMVEAEFEQIWRQVQADLERGDVSEEDKAKPEEELQAEYRAIAERRVRLGLVLAEIGNKAGVKVNEEEMSRAIAAEVRRYPGREREAAEFLQRNEAARQQLQAPIFE